MKHFKNSTKLTIVIIALLLCSLATVTFAEEADLYVSTAGNDTWSKLPEPNADRTDGPLRTLTAARDRLREIESKDRDYLVLIRGGNYVLDETVVFGLEDGTQYGGYYGRIYKITYAAYPKDQPVFTSGVPIRGWKKLHDHPANLIRKGKRKSLGRRCAGRARAFFHLI